MVAALAVLVLAAGVSYSLRATLAVSQAFGSQENLYISSPEVLKKVSFGYNGLLADIYWTRAVQYFGFHHRTDRSYPLLEPLLEIANELDPHLVVVCEVGSTFLAQKPPEGAGDPDAAIRLAERGIQENPSVWRLYYQLGFIQYLEKKDYAAAAHAFEAGSRVPGAHPWLHIMAAMMEHNAGDVETERYLWEHIRESTGDPSIRRNAEKHLLSLKAGEQIRKLQAIVSEYRATTGRLPAGFQDLINAKLIPGVPLDPFNLPYKLINGEIQLQDPARFPFLEKARQ